MPNSTATTPGASMASRQDNQGKGGVGLLLLLGAGAAASAYLLTRPKSNCTILGATYANAVIQDTDSGEYYLTDGSANIYGPYTSAQVAGCLTAGQTLYQASSDVINACTVLPATLACPTPTPMPVTPTPTPSGPTWAAWWPTASLGDRTALVVWWTCLLRAPGTAPEPGQPLPLNADPAESYYNGGCGGTEYYWFPDGYSQENLDVACAAFRFITDQGCEFWSGLGVVTTHGPGNICEPTGNCLTSAGLAGSRLLGRSWSPGACDPAESFGPQPIDGATGTTMRVVCETEYQGRVASLAGAATPPFGG